jgi:hypothetical protein
MSRDFRLIPRTLNHQLREGNVKCYFLTKPDMVKGILKALEAL